MTVCVKQIVIGNFFNTTNEMNVIISTKRSKGFVLRNRNVRSPWLLSRGSKTMRKSQGML